MAFDRSAAAAWYRRNRARSREIFDLLAEEAYYSRPIALRHPIVFYEGHLPGFSFNTLLKKGLGRPSIDPRLEALFASMSHALAADTKAIVAHAVTAELRAAGVSC